MNIKERATLKTIKISRYLFANTFIARLPLTDLVFRKVFSYSYGKKDFIARYLDVKFLVPAQDITITPGIVGNYYEKHELSIYRQLSKQSKVILDVGGNIGLYACIGGKNMPNTGTCYTFEPVPKNIKYLKKNVDLNNLKNVKIISGAVGDSKGTLQIYLSPTDTGTNSASSELHKNAKKIQVPVTTIDEFCKENKLTKKVDIIKIDIEGFDGHAIRGAQNVIKTSKPTMFVEFIPHLLESCDFNVEDLSKLLFNHYKFIYAIDESHSKFVELKGNGKPSSNNFYNVNLILTNDKNISSLIKSEFSNR